MTGSAIRHSIAGLVVTIALIGMAITVYQPHRVRADEPKGAVLLTVAGDVSKPNRGPFDPETDKFFGHNDLDFKAATGFDLETLARLDPVRITADFPKDGPVHTFEGPSLAAVLEAAGAKGEIARLVALDGYAIEVPVKDLLRKGAVLAMKRDGQPLGIGDFGPLQLVFPRADREDLAEMNDDNWIWSVFLIDVK
ncbi:MAG: hypothetical protein D6754_03425 [Alphaproteobacteria bacterium]|nr:MAG: hypothetical protein D6754_03425 [Alphaproteobacteria bacterium]